MRLSQNQPITGSVILRKPAICLAAAALAELMRWRHFVLRQLCRPNFLGNCTCLSRGISARVCSRACRSFPPTPGGAVLANGPRAACSHVLLCSPSFGTLRTAAQQQTVGSLPRQRAGTASDYKKICSPWHVALTCLLSERSSLRQPRPGTAPMPRMCRGPPNAAPPRAAPCQRCFCFSSAAPTGQA